MARKLPRLQRALNARALFSVAYGEIASSIYFALGVIALHALGFTPAVLLVVGVIFLLVSLSYAEGTAAIPETGGAATLVRRTFNDLAGFTTGWALFLDYLIVIALSGLTLPHYVGSALGIDSLRHRPWDVVVGVGVIAVIALVRLVRRSNLYNFSIFVAVVDLGTQLLLVGLGFALLLSPEALSSGTSLGSSPTGARSLSRCRSPSWPIRASRRWPTWPRRSGGPASTCRAASSARSSSSWACTWPSPSSASRRFPRRAERPPSGGSGWKRR